MALDNARALLHYSIPETNSEWLYSTLASVAAAAEGVQVVPCRL